MASSNPCTCSVSYLLSVAASLLRFPSPVDPPFSPPSPTPAALALSHSHCHCHPPSTSSPHPPSSTQIYRPKL